MSTFSHLDKSAKIRQSGLIWVRIRHRQISFFLWATLPSKNEFLSFKILKIEKPLETLTLESKL
jgi:hypothetical protein